MKFQDVRGAIGVASAVVAWGGLALIVALFAVFPIRFLMQVVGWSPSPPVYFLIAVGAAAIPSAIAGRLADEFATEIYLPKSNKLTNRFRAWLATRHIHLHI